MPDGLDAFPQVLILRLVADGMEIIEGEHGTIVHLPPRSKELRKALDGAGELVANGEALELLVDHVVGHGQAADSVGKGACDIRDAHAKDDPVVDRF